mmetsp:Transcript_18005/g.30656  ORF Transcript_18005/g.30656 Transcript_18005/m.30656 type:complete len:219 (-) Transcript_18005:659-1315(-)
MLVLSSVVRLIEIETSILQRVSKQKRSADLSSVRKIKQFKFDLVEQAQSQTRTVMFNLGASHQAEIIKFQGNFKTEYPQIYAIAVDKQARANKLIYFEIGVSDESGYTHLAVHSHEPAVKPHKGLHNQVLLTFPHFIPFYEPQVQKMTQCLPPREDEQEEEELGGDQGTGREGLQGIYRAPAHKLVVECSTQVLKLLEATILKGESVVSFEPETSDDS